MKKSLIFLLFLMTHLFCLPLAFAEGPLTNNSYSIEILSPKPEETFQNGAQSIVVELAIKPELATDDNVAVYVDGIIVKEPTHNTSIEIPYLERGPHTIQAKIIQKSGAGAETSTITIYQQRVSLLLPRH